MRLFLGILAVATLCPGPAGPPALSAQLTPREADEMLGGHNRWRARHDAPPLTWSEELATYAQAWAETLVARHPGRLLHSEEAGGVLPEAAALGYAGWGENLYWGSAIQWSDGQREANRGVPPSYVVDSWGNEVQWYDFATGECSPRAEDGCGHFTQIVWAASATVGCGRAFGSDGAQVWACSYDPPGNYVGRNAENVLPPRQH